MIRQRMRVRVPIFVMSLILVFVYLPLDFKEIVSSNAPLYEFIVSLVTLTFLGTVLGGVLSRCFFYEIGINYFSVNYGVWRSFYILTGNDVVNFSSRKISISLKDHGVTVVLRNELSKKDMSKVWKLVQEEGKGVFAKQFFVK